MDVKKSSVLITKYFPIIPHGSTAASGAGRPSADADRELRWLIPLCEAIERSLLIDDDSNHEEEEETHAVLSDQVEDEYVDAEGNVIHICAPENAPAGDDCEMMANTSIPAPASSLSSIIPEKSETPVKKKRSQYTPEQKAEILNDVKLVGMTRACAIHHVTGGVVRKWRLIVAEAVAKARKESLESGRPFEGPDTKHVLRNKRTEKAGRGRLPESVEGAIVYAIKLMRANGVSIGVNKFQGLARDIVKNILVSRESDENSTASANLLTDRLGVPVPVAINVGPLVNIGDSEAQVMSEFKGSYDWAARCMVRHKLVMRRATTAALKRPLMGPDTEENLRRIFLARLAWTCREFNIPAELVFHADETGSNLLPHRDTAVHEKGSKTVPMLHYGEKRQATVMVGGNICQTYLPPFVLFDGIGPTNLHKQLEKESDRDSFELEADIDRHLTPITWADRDSHWMSCDAVKVWLNDVLMPTVREQRSALGTDPDHPFILMWDVYYSHRTEDTLTYIRSKYPELKLVFVPSGCTDFLQIFDVAMGRPFKMYVTKRKEEWEMKNIFGPILSKQWIQIRDRQRHEGWNGNWTKKDVQCALAKDAVGFGKMAATKVALVGGLSHLRPLFVRWVHEGITILRKTNAMRKGAERIGIVNAVNQAVTS